MNDDLFGYDIREIARAARFYSRPLRRSVGTYTEDVTLTSPFTIPERAVIRVSEFAWKIDLSKLTQEEINAFLRKMPPMVYNHNPFNYNPPPSASQRVEQRAPAPETAPIKALQETLNRLKCRVSTCENRTAEYRKDLAETLALEATTHAEIAELEAAIKKLSK